MNIRQLGQNGPKVSAIGYGCMGLDFGYAHTVSRADGISLIRAAVERGDIFRHRRSLWPMDQRRNRRRGARTL
jgi:hypothetical protein